MRREICWLRACDWLGGARVDEVSIEAYPHEATYDILLGSDTGAYFAASYSEALQLARTNEVQTPARHSTEMVEENPEDIPSSVTGGCAGQPQRGYIV